MTPHTETLRRVLSAASTAMAEENISENTRERVINRVVWGDPRGCLTQREEQAPGGHAVTVAVSHHPGDREALQMVQRMMAAAMAEYQRGGETLAWTPAPDGQGCGWSP